MRKKKKPIMTLLSLALTVGLAVGCSNNSDPSNQTEVNSGNAVQKEKTKISFWTGGRHDAEYIKEKVKTFNETNTDNIEVEMTVMADNFQQSVDLAFASGQAPDVLTTANNKESYNKGYYEPLNDYLTEDMEKKFGEFIVENSNQFNGDLISLPNSASTIRLIYNAEIFEKAGLTPPKSLDEMVAAAKKITEIGKEEGIYGWALPYKGPASALDRSMAKLAEINGMSRTGYDFKTGKYDFTGWKPLVEAFRQMKVDGSTLPGAESLDIDPMRAQFAEGKIGMYISYSVEPGVYQTQFPAKIKWDAAPVPTLDGGEPKSVIDVGGTSWLSLSSKSEHKEEAWKFIEYMYGNDIQRGYYEQGLGLSVLPSVLEGAKEPTIPGIKNFLATKFDGFWPIAPQGVKPEGKTWQEVFTAYIYTGGNLDQILKDVTDRYNAALDKAVKEGSVSVNPDPNFDPSSLVKQ